MHDLFGWLVQILGSRIVVLRWRQEFGGKLGKLLDIEESPISAVDTHVHVLVADVVKSFDTVDRWILDRVLRSLCLLVWYRHAYF